MRAALAAAAAAAAAAPAAGANATGLNATATPECCSTRGANFCGTGIFHRPQEVVIGGARYCCPAGASVKDPCPSSNPAPGSPSGGVLSVAQRRLRAAYGSYCDAAKLSDWSCKWCGDLGAASSVKVLTNSGTGAQAFVAVLGSEIVVSFRGSSNIQNWVKNADFPRSQVTWQGVPDDVYVHDGFKKSYESVRSGVMSAVRSARAACTGCAVVVTGHSLGAAEAQLCAADLKASDGVSPDVFTFGSPRMWNAVGAQWFHGSVAPGAYRMVNEKDVVPHLPPANLGYTHTPREIWRSGGQYLLCGKDVGEDPQCSYQVAADKGNVGDHLQYMGVQETCE